ncbi:PIG-L family deacetylase [uncultured Phascolarctobacterium sp.]|uniref:PIG-L deacetylase family protein n=1 Tax=uncultured Phascolarctobacterium sp. TaxID=512296 RepID=UPI0025D75427|nr:PIG-L family deacetylase [uncultured Phascolarctobacterium sp.]
MLNLHGNKKILILVPHEDDEINLMGGLLPLLVELGAEVQVCFLTNGDFAAHAAVRLQEALASLECLGIDRRQVYFLGYPDASDVVDHSIYHASEPVLGKNGYYTYGCTMKQEYRMEKSKRHSLTNYAGLCEDLTELIIDIKPEIIFCTDIDGHHDHRLCSLTFEECIENILQNNDLNTSPNYL